MKAAQEREVCDMMAPRLVSKARVGKSVLIAQMWLGERLKRLKMVGMETAAIACLSRQKYYCAGVEVELVKSLGSPRGELEEPRPAKDCWFLESQLEVGAAPPP